MKFFKFAAKLKFIILGVSIVSMTAIFSVSYNGLLRVSYYSREINEQLGGRTASDSKDALIDQAEYYLLRLSKSQADGYNAVLLRTQNNVAAMAGYMEALYRNPNNFTGRRLPLPNETPPGIPAASIMTAGNVIRSTALENEMLLVSNAEYMFENIYDTNPRLSLVYLGTETGIHFRYTAEDIYEPNYDPRVRPWYVLARNAGGPVWTNTYVSSFNEELCVTSAAPYKNAQGQTAGVVAADILLTDLIHEIVGLRIGETGYAFMLDNLGSYIAHPYYNDIDKNELDNDSSYKEVLGSMANGGSGVRGVSIDGADYYIAYAPLPVTGWSLGIAVEHEEIISGALLMMSVIDSHVLEAEQQINEMINAAGFNFIILLFGIIIIVLIVSILVSNSFTRPIIELTNGVISVGNGELDNKLNIQTKDEIGVLAQCFNKMTDDLKNYIENLSKVTAEKERIGAELSIATEIQADMLPKIFPPFSNRDDIHIAPMMQPAKEVGGDFYDFFFLDDGQSKLALIIADVSGKGVPAALFMVIAKIIIKNNKDLPVDQILSAVNNMLCADNNSSMFVTAFYSVLDLATGEYAYSSAGHNPPVLYRAFDNTAAYLVLPKTPPLGLFLNKKFPAQTEILKNGDMILLYTDGVTEAFNTESKMYGSERLLANLLRLSGNGVESIVIELNNTIKDFAGSEPQSDDITMVCFRFLGQR